MLRLEDIVLNSNPKLTVAMPVFNGSNFIRDALDTIVNQSFTDFELIVCDNASRDDTCEIVQQYASRDSRIELIKNPRNIGASANYNLAFKHGRGEYLKWCAHDDKLCPNYLAACIAVLDRDPDVALAFGSTLGITGRNDIVRPVGDETPSLDSDDPAKRFKQALELCGTCFPIFGVFRRANLTRSTLHRPYYGSDRAVLAEAAIMGKFQRVEEAIFYNREHEKRSINIDDKVQRSLWQTGKKSRGAAAEHLQLTRHLFEIASRHRDVVSPWPLRATLLRRSLSPIQLGRFGLELVHLASPAAAKAAKNVFVRPQRNQEARKVV
jgi:glycosyltransferase involved in cell wall biosynthesis